MDAYSKFCKKAKLQPDISYMPPSKVEKVKEEKAPKKDLAEIQKKANQNGSRKVMDLGVKVKGEKNNIRQEVNSNVELKLVIDEPQKSAKN